MNKNMLVRVAGISLGALLIATPALAHVVVKPNQAGVGAFQTFTMGVPVEKDMPTTAMRLVMPEGLNYVTPNVKPGWKIDVKKSGEEKVTEISWTGGTIPAGQRDDFVFSAQVPAEPTTLNWKAYQTYQDGSVVAWDQDPSLVKSDDDDSITPYSTTKVINDLVASSPATAPTQTSDRRATMLSIIALALSAVALATAWKKR